MDEHYFGLIKLLVFGALGIGLGVHQLWSLRRAREKQAKEKWASEKAAGKAASGGRDPAA
ncbi:hypothetical protein [Rhabdaerophilum sp. SD176]|uniref:hypothetical protein n=1 Tax=Rhabdaerophilum sp. SD176 TaxID=2983548 RepID=UPI0024E014EF|nr:hypothetical protein [Rhabdaerophilum sp. SD176]